MFYYIHKYCMDRYLAIGFDYTAYESEGIMGARWRLGKVTRPLVTFFDRYRCLSTVELYLVQYPVL